MCRTLTSPSLSVADSASASTSSALAGCCAHDQVRKPSSTNWSAAGRWKFDKHEREERVLLPDRLIAYEVQHGEVFPEFLGPEAGPRLRVVIEEHERFVGRPERELAARTQSRLPCANPHKQRLLAAPPPLRIEPPW